MKYLTVKERKAVLKPNDLNNPRGRAGGTSQRSGSFINRHAGCRLCFQAFCLPRRRLVPPLWGFVAVVWVGFCQWDERGKASPPDESCFLHRTVTAGVNDPSVLEHMRLCALFSSATATAIWDLHQVQLVDTGDVPRQCLPLSVRAQLR